jgi:hypothetical protein
MDDAFNMLPRSGHSAFCFKEQFICIHGGIHDVTKEMDDVCLFNL